ncbi:MAG: exodeoxyribonuclease III [Frankia sp.]
MRIATWNVNSARARQVRLVDWLDRAQPDVVCLQETKLSDHDFLAAFDEDLFRRGYAAAHHGDGRWNGVALLSRVGLADVERGLADGPGFPDPEPRAIAATCAGIRVWSVYVPNGRTPDDPHYAYKLTWLEALARAVGPHAAGAAVVAGDFNIAPTDADVFDPAAFAGSTHVTPPEREALAAVEATGFTDVLRRRWPQERFFTYWDYRNLSFVKDTGMRIDLVLASAEVDGRVKAAWVDRAARKGKGTSDHAPVVIDLDEAPDGDVGPLVPPPSAGRGRS